MEHNERLNGLLGFFEPTVLAQYRLRPDRYQVTGDDFEGEVTLTDEYYERLSEEERDRLYLSIRFGYRTLKSGEIRLAAFLPDLVDKSAGHVHLWQPHLTRDTDWVDFNDDNRFSRWVRRYFEGDWDVDNGPAFQLFEEIN